MLLKGAYCVGEHFVDPHSTQLDYHGYFSPRSGQRVPITQKKVSYIKYHV